MSTTPRPTRYSTLSLQDVVCLCAGPCDDEAWEEFVSRAGKPIGLTIMRTVSLWGEPYQALVEDLIQATYLKLWEDGCRLLRDFAMQHPEAILGYIKKPLPMPLTTISSMVTVKHPEAPNFMFPRAMSSPRLGNRFMEARKKSILEFF
jgi:hypothetical protein